MVANDSAAAVAAGLFLHLARLMKPYDAARAKRLVDQSQKAFAFISGKMADPEKLYYYIQKYLYEGDEAAHTQVKALQGAVDSCKGNALAVYGYGLNNGKFSDPGYVIGYMVEKTRPTDPAVIEHFKTAIKGAADAAIAELKKHAYPVGNSGGGWSHNAMQASYAAAPLLYWRFSKEQAYFDAAANLINYTLGLNPLGISYITGVGFHRVEYPHDRESAYTIKQGWGPKPGITVFGPGTGGGNTTFPAIGSLPPERQYADNRGDIQKNEFTIFETMSHYALYTVLSDGGKWNATRDPFVSGSGPPAGSSTDGGAADGGGAGGAVTGSSTGARGGSPGAGGAPTGGAPASSGGAGGAGGATATSSSRDKASSGCSCSTGSSSDARRLAAFGGLIFLGALAFRPRRRR